MGTVRPSPWCLGKRRSGVPGRGASASGGSTEARAPAHGPVGPLVTFAALPPHPMAARKPRRPSAPAPRSASRSTTRGAVTMPFSRQNYVLLLAAVGLIVLGYAVMLFDNATSDNPVDSALSLVVAPLLLLGGYLGVAAAVLWGVPRDAGPDTPPAPADPAPEAA